jgi:hypothetical protein
MQCRIFRPFIFIQRIEARRRGEIKRIFVCLNGISGERTGKFIRIKRIGDTVFFYDDVVYDFFHAFVPDADPQRRVVFGVNGVYPVIAGTDDCPAVVDDVCLDDAAVFKSDVKDGIVSGKRDAAYRDAEIRYIMNQIFVCLKAR